MIQLANAEDNTLLPEVARTRIQAHLSLGNF